MGTDVSQGYIGNKVDLVPLACEVALSREANRKSKKLSPFVKMVENHEGVNIHLGK